MEMLSLHLLCAEPTRQSVQLRAASRARAKALFSSLNSWAIEQGHDSEQHKSFLYTALHFPHDQTGICHLS